MAAPEKLLIFGASARAAAFSALRAGLEPWCADLFADADLQARCLAGRLPSHQYPHGFLQLARACPVAPWTYTGGLENHPGLVQAIAKRLPLWSNDKEALECARSPMHLIRILNEVDCPTPIVFDEFPESFPTQGRWLLKPLAGTGGRGIRFWREEPIAGLDLRRHYLQEYVRGKEYAALYVADRDNTRLLGVTRQLVGKPQVHAVPFQYCGSIGPVWLSAYLSRVFQGIGKVIAQGCGLRGVFGIDCVLHDDFPYVVEVNPRYTASVEVLEYATGISVLALHRAVFDSSAQPLLAPRAHKKCVIGKAILFARAPLIFPADGPWMESLRHPGDIWEMPAFADIPHPGTPIETGQPILTFFARADTADRCREELQQIAAGLDHFLFGK